MPTYNYSHMPYKGRDSALRCVLRKFEWISFFSFDFARLGHYFDLALVELFAVRSPSDASRMRIIGFRRV
jgi:hypothetical protein